eukprot:m.337730 g.337730  ORF g.337730 m.337730 type:complete len:396 (+) comp18219_c0_seq1:106-1293(+)
MVSSVGCGSLLLYLALVLCPSSAEVLNRVIFPEDVANKYNAKCLDGTSGGFYMATNTSSTGWVIYLQGGGLCVTFADCKARTKGNLGSSKHWDETFTDTTNVLSGNDDGNPFGSYNKIYVPYCTGDTWTGTNPDNKYLDGLHTCGHNIITALLDFLYNTTSFKDATHLLLSGGSAGGIGVFHNMDYVTDRVKNLGVQAIVKGSPQAGFYFPPEVILYPVFAVGLHIPFDLFGAAYAHIIEGGYVNEACAKALGSEKQRCWDVNVVQKYIKTPLFVAQNILDQNQIDDVLLCPDGICDPHGKHSTGLAFLKDYANKSKTALMNFAATHSTGSVWAPACHLHTEDLCTSREVYVNNVTYADTLSSWFFQEKRSVNIEMCNEDDVACNKHCAKGCGDA